MVYILKNVTMKKIGSTVVIIRVEVVTNKCYQKCNLGVILMKIDLKTVYKDRIEEINNQIRKAIKNKKWTDKSKLEAEKVDLQNKIKQIEVNRNESV